MLDAILNWIEETFNYLLSSGFFGELTPFQIIVSVFALWAGGYIVYKNFLQRAIIFLHPPNSVGLVLSPPGVTRKFHLPCNLLNTGAKTGVIHRLEATVTTPEKKRLNFAWNLFYDYSSDGTILNKKTDTHPVAVAQRDSTLLFVEFQLEPPTQTCDWQAETYQFKITGWVNQKNRRSSPNLKSTPFHIHPTPQHVDSLQKLSQQEHVISVPITEWQV